MIITDHRWFVNKSCPGNWLYSRLGKQATEVTKQLGGTKTEEPMQKLAASSKVLYKVQVSITDLNIRKGPGMNYDKIGKYTGKDVFTSTEERSGKGAIKGGTNLSPGLDGLLLNMRREYRG